MKTWVWILCGAMLLGLGAPERRLEERRPAALLYIRRDGEEIRAETDQGDKGKGDSLREALQSLQDGASGCVLLDTLEFVVLDAGNEDMQQQAAKLLHPGARICGSQGELSPAAALDYLQVHGRGYSLLKCRQQERGLPVLEKEEEGFRWRPD